jgi:hypothetical protein
MQGQARRSQPVTGIDAHVIPMPDRSTFAQTAHSSIANQTSQHYAEALPLCPPGASSCWTSDIRKICEVPGPFWPPTSPLGVGPTTLHDEEPLISGHGPVAHPGT